MLPKNPYYVLNHYLKNLNPAFRVNDWLGKGIHTDCYRLEDGSALKLFRAKTSPWTTWRAEFEKQVRGMRWVTRAWSQPDKNKKYHLQITRLQTYGWFAAPMPSGEDGKEYHAYIRYTPAEGAMFDWHNPAVSFWNRFADTSGKALAAFHERMLVPRDFSVLPCGNALDLPARPNDPTLRKAIFMATAEDGKIAGIPASEPDRNLARLTLEKLHSKLDAYVAPVVVNHNDTHRRHLLTDPDGNVLSLIYYGNLGIGPPEMAFAQLTGRPEIQDRVMDSYERATNRHLDRELALLAGSVWSLYSSYVLRSLAFKAEASANLHRLRLSEMVKKLATAHHEFTPFIKPSRPDAFKHYLNNLLESSFRYNAA